VKRQPTAQEAPSPGVIGAWAHFWFTPTDPFGLHVVRVATGVLMIFWLLTLTADAGAFFTLDGWFDRAAYLEASRLPEGMPRPASWSLLYLFEGAAAFQAFFWGSLLALTLFTLGVAPRVTAVLAWVIASSFSASPAFDDEVESLFALMTLYLAFGYLLMGPWRGVSWLERVLGPWRTFLFARGHGPAAPTVIANVALRLLQVHLCILIVVSGLHKLQNGAWWSGIAHWFMLHPPLELSRSEVNSLSGSAQTYLLWLHVLGFGTLAWQFAFPAFAWRTGRARILLLGGGVLGWIGLAGIYRMPVYGPALLTGCLAFVTAREWQAVRQFAQVWAARTFSRYAPEPVQQMADVPGGR
jgi:hypothetical protein